MPKAATDISALLAQPRATYTGTGLTSKQEVTVSFYEAEPGSGIVFVLPCEEGEVKLGDGEGGERSWILLPATTDSVVNTLRNVTVGRGKTRLCIVEHLLCAVALCGIFDLYIQVDGPELPLGNGSADFWVDLFESAGLRRQLRVPDVELAETVVASKGDRCLIACPDDKFSVTYMMDWNHPEIGRVWRSWTPDQEIGDICDARTFGSLMEHKMLGLEKDVVSFTAEGFTMPLRFPDEPVRHKLLDLIGDLMLCGVNPLRIKARFVSIKGGHELDVELARKLAAALPV